MSFVWDVCVVGAGPGGSTCAYYLAQQGKRVLLLEKAKFPRDKLCGDAVVPRAQVHLARMGILDHLLTTKQALRTTSGGFISPSGIECLGDSQGNPRGTGMAVKRIVLDERIARAAQNAGAHLVEGTPALGAEFSWPTGTWTIRCRRERFRARCLVAADGAQSPLARSLGIVTNRPTAICSRAYVRAGTHAFDLDGVCYMDGPLLPGYAGLFRHPDDELNFCCYILPGGRCAPTDLSRMHHGMLQANPFLKRHLGPRYEIECMKGAWLRVGGISKSYGRHLLIVGDAAGQIDPLTGEGIQFAMEGAQHAADTLAEAFALDDFGEALLCRYQRRWMQAFGKGFRFASLAGRMLARFPGLIDAVAAATVGRGDHLFAAWAEVMMGTRSWLAFLDPRLAMPIVLEIFRRSCHRFLPAGS